MYCIIASVLYYCLGVRNVDYFFVFPPFLPKDDLAQPPIHLCTSMQEQHQNILTCFPGDAGILTSAEACMSLTLTHMNSVAHQWVQAADYVEFAGRS